MKAAVTMSLSARGSRSMPRVVIWPRRRARKPSRPSVTEAVMKMAEAMSSCSPWGPCQGKRGESAQISSGTLAMRVSVMELGRFTDGAPCGGCLPR